jgi:hypothetical protein
MRVMLTLVTAGLFLSIPCRGDAGGPADRFGMGNAGGFRQSGAFSASPRVLGVSPSFRFHNRSLWYPFVPQDSGPVYIAPPQVVVVPMLVQPVSPEVPVPVPDPKFVSPPTPSAPSQPGSHTVIVQRGSQIEVQSFPAAR